MAECSTRTKKRQDLESEFIADFVQITRNDLNFIFPCGRDGATIIDEEDRCPTCPIKTRCINHFSTQCDVPPERRGSYQWRKAERELLNGCQPRN